MRGLSEDNDLSGTPSSVDSSPKKAWMTVADFITQDVRAGVFAPGMWLKQIDLESRYGHGRPDVRRALDYLAQKRLVQHVPNRGYHVFKPDGDQTAHILELRVILETAAVDSIIARATPAAVERIADLARRFDDTILQGTILGPVRNEPCLPSGTPRPVPESRAFQPRDGVARPHLVCPRRAMEHAGRGLSSQAANTLRWWKRLPPETLCG